MALIGDTMRIHASRIDLPLLAFLAIVIMPCWLNARPAFGHNSQDSQSGNRPQDPAPQDREARQDRSSQNPDDHQPITLPEGSVIPVRIADEVSSKHDRPGEMFSGTVDPSVLINDRVVIPGGTEAHMRMVHRKRAGISMERQR